MCRLFAGTLLAMFLASNALAQECEQIVAELKIPVKLKTRGKPRVGKWEKVDEVLNDLGRRLESVACELTFGDLFRNKKEDEMLFPLTNTVLRTVPESSLVGVEVLNQEGETLGTYANRVPYERSGGLQLKKSYTTYYFQILDSAEKLQSVGHQLLLDNYVVRWVDIENKVALSGK